MTADQNKNGGNFAWSLQAEVKSAYLANYSPNEASLM
jgi:hypothetical protein